MNKQVLLLAALSWSSMLFAQGALAQQSMQPSGTAPTAPKQSSLNGQDQRLLQQFKQQHPNWSANHPQMAQFYKNHPKALDQSIDKYGMRQFGQKHDGWVDSHPKQAKFDYNHPNWTENHPGRALGLGRSARRGR